MIIFENKNYHTCSLFPKSDWTGEAKFVVEDNTELANKIISLYPYYDFVLNEKGELVDVEETERPEPEPEPQPEPTELEQIWDSQLDQEFRICCLEMGMTADTVE